MALITFYQEEQCGAGVIGQARYAAAACLAEDQFNRLIDSFEMVHYQIADRIIRQGEVGNTFYIILKGSVTVSKAARPVRKCKVWKVLSSRPESSRQAASDSVSLLEQSPRPFSGC